jgi:hypothetical protein
MAVLKYPRSATEVIGEVITQLTTLLRKEVQLARTEMSENMSRLAMGLGLIIGGAVLLIPALVILLQAGVAALVQAYGLAAYWSALIIGGGVLLLGVILLLIGINRLKVENLIPSKTIHQLQRDASVAKDQVRQDHDLQRAA